MWSEFVQHVALKMQRQVADKPLLSIPRNESGAPMKHAIAFATLVVLLGGCKAIPLQPGAAQVRLTNEEPKGCKFLGDITGNQGNSFTGSFTSNRTMESGARHDIKNQASAMGGNVVYLLTNRAGQTGSFDEYGGNLEQTNVTLSGNVYACPEE